MLLLGLEINGHYESAITTNVSWFEGRKGLLNNTFVMHLYTFKGACVHFEITRPVLSIC